MRLTQHTDYSLRVLLYLAVHPEGGTVPEIARVYDVSQHHLVKVVHNLGKQGFVHTKRGKGGGVSLGKPAEEIRIGDAVRRLEPHFNLAECFNRSENTCPITGTCALTHALVDAQEAFLASLNRYTLADMSRNAGQLRKLLAVSAD
jgi:Rrf2 family nitric oxide-sensitive transcriptional repressor